MVSITSLIPEIRRTLVAGNFKDLLIEVLGWDNPRDARSFTVNLDDDREIAVAPIATKRGMTVFHCGEIPTADVMARIDRAISKKSLERLIIYSDDQQQVWRWPESRKAGGTRFVSHRFEPDTPSDALVQRLVSVHFEIDEEQNLTILDVLQRVRSALNSDEVTEKFYKEYKANHEMLCETIKGLKTPEDKSWYASLMLNRLMFIYFMQKKGFLDNNANYLRDSLVRVRNLRGKNKFYKYYRDFLLPLFHEGLGSEEAPQVDAKIQQIIGDVPYINGGIFAKHLLEESSRLNIPDEAFEEVFGFLDRYRWHLDERTIAAQGEINPEVLGYIFEKYVNQKQQGAYYTKEDVTGYMVTSTIVPVILARLSGITNQVPWSLIAEQPLRYVPESMRFGMDQAIPEEIVSARLDQYGKLDELADSTVGLPGERWRESLERHARVRQIVERASRGEINDVVVVLELNLDILTFALDWVSALRAPKEIAKTWILLKSLNILDPTCGSGAFLFAAADVLEEFYEVVIGRATELLAEGKDTKDKELLKLVEEMKRHPSDSYFRLKTIVLENIYGVDIMAEAIEIARLRLFLTLVARLERRDEIEPLPDLDMNIKVGNTLVGCSTFANAESTFSGSLLAIQQLNDLKPQVDSLTASYNNFVEIQRSSTSGAKLIAAKRDLMSQSATVRSSLDRLFASETGITNSKFDKWKQSHLPFHWFVEFPEALSSGGFDVVIGNPPYIKRTEVLKQYRFSGFRSGELYDIFAPCMERSISLLRNDGAFSMIVPIAFQFSDEYSIIRKLISDAFPLLYISTYSRRPSALFDAGVRPSIVVGHRNGQEMLFAGSIRRWRQEFRQHLFQTLKYSAGGLSRAHGESWPRPGSQHMAQMLQRLLTRGGAIGKHTVRSGHEVGFKKIALYYLSVYVNEPPAWDMQGNRVPHTATGSLAFSTVTNRDLAFVVLAGRLGFWWWSTVGDDFNVTAQMFESFPVSIDELQPIKTDLVRIAQQLKREQLLHPLVTKKAGKWNGNFDMSRCRHITDKSDRMILAQLGLSDYWTHLLLSDSELVKSTDEISDSRREWPFPL